MRSQLNAKSVNPSKDILSLRRSLLYQVDKLRLYAVLCCVVWCGGVWWGGVWCAACAEILLRDGIFSIMRKAVTQRMLMTNRKYSKSKEVIVEGDRE